ncbi:MAG: hypothetical protein L6Q76_06900, partial [Polyangiaceae bacterium]|nr:hypothetical protein [Polyangiaceae bacterium]
MLSKRSISLLLSGLMTGACAGEPSPPPAVGNPSAPAKIAPPPPAPPPAAELPPISTEFPLQYAKTHGFSLGQPRRMTPTADGRLVLFLRSTARDPRSSLWEVDVATGATRELLRPDSL